MRPVLVLVVLLNSFSLLAQVNDKIPYWNTSSQVELPYDRLIQPAGTQIFFGRLSMENHALDCSLSPDGLWLAVQERTSIVIINTSTNEVVFEYYVKDFPAIHDLANNYSGITWHQVKSRYYVLWSASSRRYNLSYVLKAQWDGEKLEVEDNLTFKAKFPARNAIPNEFLVNYETDKFYIYTVLNGNNQVIKQELNTKDTAWISQTGVAPYGIAMANNKIYITNWGGGTPQKGDKNVAGVPWGLAKVDSLNGATREGTVTVLNINDGSLVTEIPVGLHPNDIIADEEQKFVFLCNANSDNISVIRTAVDTVCETISLRLNSEMNPYWGDSPVGLSMSKKGDVLYVANGLDNAVAVIGLGSGLSSKSKLVNTCILGFLPTGAYPTSIAPTAHNYLYITNLEARGPDVELYHDSLRTQKYYNTHYMQASVSFVPVPSKKQLENYTQLVFALNNLNRISQTQLPARPGIKPVPVPERIGEPSVFRHVLYIIKENRTYDQVLGDVKGGDGDAALCIYGEEVTPNTHRLVNEFPLLDNFHVSGKSSSDGHQWTDASIVTDYIEKNMRSWLRSYTHVQNDALVYSPTGFIWDNAMKYNKNVRIYGEAAVPIFNDDLDWSDIYKNFKKGVPLKFENNTTLDPVRKILSQNYPGYEQMTVPDILRADAFIRELKAFESMPGDQFPELMIMALPNDHTAGTRPGYPTPEAMMADNDLALGQIVEAVSKSRFWESTVIFVIEDDSQDGWDHVSAFRSVGMVISPYSRMTRTVHSRYNQPSVIRTIEQILGIPPMNIQDAIAPLMFDCFIDKLNLAPYTALPNNIPLDKMNPPLSGLQGRELKFARESLEPQFNRIDSGFDDQFNRILWFAAKGNLPYPEKYAGKDD